MIRLCEYDYSQDTPTLYTVAILDKAKGVKILQEINGNYALSFTIPFDSKAELIKCNSVLDCEGQLFKIMNKSRSVSGEDTLSVEAWHIFLAESKFIYHENVGSYPSYYGVNPQVILHNIFEDSPFHILSNREAENLGLKNVGSDGFLIDFESTDKITNYEVVEKILECCGKGELYIDNYNIGLVERLGNDSKLNLDISKSMTNINISEDITEMVTRLYAYGSEDTPISSVNPTKKNYIDSPNISKYGMRTGYKDYEYEDPANIFRAALFEFGKTFDNEFDIHIYDVDNPNRIDIPSINISGSFVDLSRVSGFGEFHRLNLGDGVTVKNGTDIYKERIISIEKYPYETELGSLSIGRVRKDLYFYLNQMRRKQKKTARNTSKASSTMSKTDIKAYIDNLLGGTTE